MFARILLDGSTTLDAAPAAIGHGAAIRPAEPRVFLTSSSSTEITRILLNGSATLDAAQPIQDLGPHAFGGPHPLPGFLLLPSEGYNISKARTSSMADLPLLRKFPLCIRVFYVRCSRTHPHFWEHTASVCIIHLCSVFARLPHPFLHSFFLRFSFLFLCAPLTICLEGY